MKLNAELFEAYLKCPTKCWLESRGETGQGNEYAEWVKRQSKTYREEGVGLLLETVPEGKRAIAPSGDGIKTAKWRWAVDLTVQVPWTTGSDSVVAKATAENGMTGQPTTAGTEPGAQPDPWFMESVLDAVERVPPEGRGKAAQFIPIRFIYRNKLTKDDRLLLAFDAFALGQTLGRGIGVGKILHGDNRAPLKVRTAPLASEVRKRADKIVVLLGSPTAPDLVLNRHCGECEYRDQCRQRAIEKDDLSLLGGMSAKERQKLRSKGIFTVTQLSYTFRPRRRPKRLRDKREKYHHSLKALAIREKKIHIVGSPELKIEGTPVFLDVEGLPDRDFYYLIGLRIGHGDAAVQHSLWADTIEDEGRIWREFMAILETVEKPVLIHYGSYETEFLGTLRERYACPSEGVSPSSARWGAVDLFSELIAQVYFSTYSNSLKDVGRSLGFTWAGSSPIGADSVACRCDWERTSDPTLKVRLIRYNREDCQAAEAVSRALARLRAPDPFAQLSEESPGAVYVKSLRKPQRRWGTFISPFKEFEEINATASWDYQRDRIYVKSAKAVRRSRETHRQKRVKWWDSFPVRRVISCPDRTVCPFCGGECVKTRRCNRTLYDLSFGRTSAKRAIARYRFHQYRCATCQKLFGEPEEFWPGSHFGRSLVAYVVYETIGLRIPYVTVQKNLARFFKLDLPEYTLRFIKKSAANQYSETYNGILRHLVNGSLLHADETDVSIRGKPAYVWVFTNFNEVAYMYADGREGAFLHELLRGFNGVLVSDFYAAYDSIGCPQQKCLVHLMRDLNDDVLAHPYDEELKTIVKDFASLLRPIVETVDRWGLKRRFLRRHVIDVKRFYRKLDQVSFGSEQAIKCKERFEKNRDKLFTFLSHDDVPWNNNNAEHAVKGFAKLRDIVRGSFTASSASNYLILLSISQTCKYMGLDFLDFLRSGEKDIHAFAESRRRRRRRPAVVEAGNPVLDAPVEP